MNKSSLAALIGALLLAAVVAPPATANKTPRKVTRTASVDYDATMQFGVITPAAAAGYSYTKEITIPSQKGERYVTLEVKDTSTTKPYFVVTFDSSFGRPHSGSEYCGGTDEAIKIPSEVLVYIWFWQGTCGSNPAPAFATKGTVEATFSNLP